MDQLSQLSEHWRQMASELPSDSERAEALNLCAEELDQFTRRSLAEAVGASEDERIRLDVAEVRIETAAEFFAVPVTDDLKSDAAKILAEIWAIGEEHQVRATDWITIVDLPTVCISAAKFGGRRAGGGAR